MADSIVPYLEDLMADTVSVRPATSFDELGRPVAYGTSRDIKCKISGNNREIRDVTGTIRVSTVKVTLAGVFSVNVTDEYTLPARFVPRIMPAIMVKRVSDENGPHHEVVYF